MANGVFCRISCTSSRPKLVLHELATEVGLLILLGQLDQVADRELPQALDHRTRDGATQTAAGAGDFRKKKVAINSEPA